MYTITGTFTVPSYYKDFCCKGGACRHTCCAGLSVNISEEEYFRMVGADCSPSLRADLDVALKPLKAADPSRYASIAPTFFGSCRLLDSREGRQGLCRVQEEWGIDGLPATCRYFPRSPRFTGGRQCAMANACEETLELLYRMSTQGEEWQTQEQTLTFVLPGEPDQDESEEAVRKWDIHQETIRRLAMLATQKAPIPHRTRETQGIQATPSVFKDSTFSGDRWKPLLRLLSFAGEEYDSVRVYCEAALLRVQSGFDEAQCAGAMRTVRAHFPQFDRFLQLALCNDMFYRFYPFSAENFSRQESRTVQESIAGMLLVLCAANLNEASTQEELIDLFAGFFRMVDLTPFDHNCLVVLKREEKETAV